MFILKDSYNNESDYDYGRSIYGVDIWSGQTFTPSENYTINSVKLYMYRSGNCGTVTVSIRATSLSVPTGADLCSGTIAQANIPTDIDWCEIDLGAGTLLTAGVKYAIVVRALSGNSSNKLILGGDNSSPTYTGGTGVWTNNASDPSPSWNTSSWDFLFETYTSEPVDYDEGIITVSGTGATNISDFQNFSEDIKYVISSASVFVLNETYSVKPFIPDKPVEPDEVWDEASQTWIADDGRGGSRFKNSLFIIAQNNSGTANLLYNV